MSDTAALHEEVNEIACSSCRTKKSKCDRRLPQCSQCIAAGNRSCQYPQSFKRGIPAGYITRLETRLAETEAALFTVLSNKQQSPSAFIDFDADLWFQQAWSCFLEKSKSISKDARTRDWDRQPLSTELFRLAWSDGMRQILQSSNPSSVTMSERPLTRGSQDFTESIESSYGRLHNTQSAITVDAIDWAQRSLHQNEYPGVVSDIQTNEQVHADSADTDSPMSAAPFMLDNQHSDRQSTIDPTFGESSSSRITTVQPSNTQQPHSRIYF